MKQFKNILFGLVFGALSVCSLDAYIFRVDQFTDESGQFEVNLFYDVHRPPTFAQIAKYLLRTQEIDTPNAGEENQSRDATELAKKRDSHVITEGADIDKGPYLYSLWKKCKAEGINTTALDSIRSHFSEHLVALMTCNNPAKSPEKLFQCLSTVSLGFQNLSKNIEKWKQEDGPQACEYYEKFLAKAKENALVKLWQDEVEPNQRETRQQIYSREEIDPKEVNWKLHLAKIKTEQAQQIDQAADELFSWLDPEIIHQIITSRNAGAQIVDLHAGGEHCRNIKKVLIGWNWIEKATGQSHWYHNGRKAGHYRETGDITEPIENGEVTELAPITICDDMFEQVEPTRIDTTSIGQPPADTASSSDE